MLLKCCTQYTSKFGKLSSGHTLLEKISFHFNSKEGRCQRMFKLPHNCIYFIYQQGHAQNPPIDALTLCELRTSRCSIWIQKSQRNQRSNFQHPLDHSKSKSFSENTYFCFIGSAKAFDYVDINKLWKILKEIGIPDHLTCLLRKKQQLEHIEKGTGSKLGKG